MSEAVRGEDVTLPFVSWAKPEHSRRQVDLAGSAYVDPGSSWRERDSALRVINNWRSCHNFPLNTFQTTLRKKARAVDPEALVAQRIKRLSSITAKLERFRGMQLSRVQDIGGCRAVTADVRSVEASVDLYETSRLKHTLVKKNDYVTDPQKSGYRGVHLVYRYHSTRTDAWNGLQIEVQVRSSIQHAWATAVETVGTFTQQALKSSQGQDSWLRFFAVMSSELAFQEETPTVPETPTTQGNVRRELVSLEQELQVLDRLHVYGETLRVLETVDVAPNAHYFLLQLDANKKTLSYSTFRKNELAAASARYEQIERSIADKAGCDAVLVAVDSLAALRRAYPNYFLDTTAFRALLMTATGAVLPSESPIFNF